MTGHPDQQPVSPYCVGDSNAGTHALCGLLLALEHRRRTGEGVARRGGRWSTPRSTSPPSRSSSTRPTAPSSSGTATAARPPPRRTSTSRPTSDEAGGRDALGGDRRRHRRAVAGPPRRARATRAGRWTPTWPPRPAGRQRARRHRRAPGGLVRGPDGPTRSSTASGRPASRSPRCSSPTSRPTLPPLQARGFFEEVDRPVVGPGPPQHAADPLLARARAPPPRPGPAAGRAHRRGAARPSA